MPIKKKPRVSKSFLQIMQLGRANGIEITSLKMEILKNSTAQNFDLLIVGFSGNQKNNIRQYLFTSPSNT